MSRLSVNRLPVRLITVTLAASALTSGAALRAQNLSAPRASNERVVFRSPGVSGIEAIAISNDAEFVATLSLKHVELFTNRGSITVCEARTGKARFSGDLGDVLRPDCTDESHVVGTLSRISFSPNGKFVVAGAVGCSVVKCWDLASGKEFLSFLFKPPVARQWFRSFWFSDDGQWLGLDLPREGADRTCTAFSGRQDMHSILNRGRQDKADRTCTASSTGQSLRGAERTRLKDMRSVVSSNPSWTKPKKRTSTKRHAVRG